MNTRFVFWATILILSLVTIGLCIRVLAIHEVPLSETLIVRGLSCLAVVVFYSRSRKLALKPKSIRTQIVRASLAGLALTFLSLSYSWLSASAVSLLSNIDVPMLVVLGPLIGIHASFKSRGLSLLSIAVLAWYVAHLEANRNLAYGLGSVLIGSTLLCFGYFYIKKSMAEENRAIAVLTPSLAILVYGVVERMNGTYMLNWSITDLTICALSGVAMFFAYISTMELYEVTDIAAAEFPTLLSAIAIQPLESIFLNEPMNMACLVASIAFVVITYVILNFQNRTEARHA